MKINRRWLAIVRSVVAVAMALVATSTGGVKQSKGVSGLITVRVDAVRLPAAEGLRQGAQGPSRSKSSPTTATPTARTTLQTKIQLFNRTGKGWPDVVFSSQNNEPVWMVEPFEFAAPLNRASSRPEPSGSGQGAVDASSAPSTAPSTASQTTSRQAMLWYNETLMESSATRCRRRGRSRRRSARRWPPSTRATSWATPGTPTPTGSTCGPASAAPASIKGAKRLHEHNEPALHPDGHACSIV